MKPFLATVFILTVSVSIRAEDLESKRQTVANTPGLVAFWDFIKREPGGEHRFTAHVPGGSSTEYPLDVANYVKDYWGQGRAASYADFPLLGRGPFGQAVRIRKETAGIRKVERGQRQYALFAGLNKAGSACGHVSENGASSFLNKYALHKCNSLGQSPEVPADSSDDVLDRSWHCFAMTLDHQRDELTGWLDGQSGDRWLENPSRGGLLQSAYNAYMQGHWHRTPGKQPGEDPSFPEDQFYNPPEDYPLSVKVLDESSDQRTEQREYRFTKVNVTLKASADGGFTETTRDLVALRLNPWWYPHGIYTPSDDGSGGPFTIGRVIHSARSVGFTGWIGGVAVFDRALSAEELASLTSLSTR